jgi:hypothetical protein
MSRKETENQVPKCFDSTYLGTWLQYNQNRVRQAFWWFSRWFRQWNTEYDRQERKYDRQERNKRYIIPREKPPAKCYPCPQIKIQLWHRSAYELNLLTIYWRTHPNQYSWQTQVRHKDIVSPDINPCWVFMINPCWSFMPLNHKVYDFDGHCIPLLQTLPRPSKVDDWVTFCNYYNYDTLHQHQSLLLQQLSSLYLFGIEKTVLNNTLCLIIQQYLPAYPPIPLFEHVQQ